MTLASRWVCSVALDALSCLAPIADDLDGLNALLPTPARPLQVFLPLLGAGYDMADGLLHPQREQQARWLHECLVYLVSYSRYLVLIALSKAFVFESCKGARVGCSQPTKAPVTGARRGEGCQNNGKAGQVCL